MSDSIDRSNPPEGGAVRPAFAWKGSSWLTLRAVRRGIVIWGVSCLLGIFKVMGVVEADVGIAREK